jgi:hypothetical protein
MLAKALKLPIEPIPATNNRRTDIIVSVFIDITRDRPDYQYIMAAWEAGLVTGRGGNRFMPDEYVTKEEAIHTIVTALGLIRLGLEPTNMTPFADDADISPWARRAMYAARRINLISPNQEGFIYPTAPLTKAGGAAIINLMVEYMRTELRADYTERIVHIAR